MMRRTSTPQQSSCQAGGVEENSDEQVEGRGSGVAVVMSSVTAMRQINLWRPVFQHDNETT